MVSNGAGSRAERAIFCREHEGSHESIPSQGHTCNGMGAGVAATKPAKETAITALTSVRVGSIFEEGSASAAGVDEK